MDLNSELCGSWVTDSVSPPSNPPSKKPNILNIDGDAIGTGKLNIDPDLWTDNSSKQGNIFERTFNKELIMDEDEVPIVLYELHENSLLYMDREEWDKALILLNKA